MFWDLVFWLLNVLAIVVEVGVILIAIAFIIAIIYVVMHEGLGTEEDNDQLDKRR